MKVRFAARNAAFWSKVDSMALRSSTSLVSGRTTFLLRGELSIRCRSIVCLTRFETLLAYSRPCSSSNSRSRRAQTPPRRHRQCVSSQIAAERDARWIQVERQQWAGVMSPPPAPPNIFRHRGCTPAGRARSVRSRSRATWRFVAGLTRYGPSTHRPCRTTRRPFCRTVVRTSAARRSTRA